MTPDEPRISSLEEAASVGRELRRAIADLLLDPATLEDRGYPHLSSPAVPRGTLSDISWLTSLHLPAFRTDVKSWWEADSELLDVQAGSMVQPWLHATKLLGDPSSPPMPPLIMPMHPGSRTRIGFFSLATDRDAFVAELLGPITPLHPRYDRRPPRVSAELAGELYDVRDAFGFGTDAGDLFGADRNAALDRLHHLAPVLNRLASGDGVRQRLFAWLLTVPDVFLRTPVGRLILPIARGAPRWRRPNLRSELTVTYDIGGMTRHAGIAIWNNGVSMRRHRAQMAAHLRYLFDYRIAPWSRRTDTRSRREIIHLHFRRGWPVMSIPAHSIREVSAALRQRFPEDYKGEGAAQALGRLYRLSSSIGRR